MGNLVQDLRCAAHTLRRNAAFVAVGLFSLAIGIEFNTAVFSLLNSTLRRPLPIDDFDGLQFLFNAGGD